MEGSYRIWKRAARALAKICNQRSGMGRGYTYIFSLANLERIGPVGDVQRMCAAITHMYVCGRYLPPEARYRKLL